MIESALIFRHVMRTLAEETYGTENSSLTLD